MANNGTKTSTRARRKTSPKVVPIKRKRRLRYGQLPVPDPRADLYWSTTQPELRGVTDAQLAHLILDSSEFEQVFGAKLDSIDSRNRTLRGTSTMGRPSRWSARQMEAVLIYRRVTGTGTVKRGRERLLLDPEAQLLLGLGQSIPSAPTITRHLTQWFEADERRDLYCELDRQLRQRVVRLPGFDEEARKLGMDGSQQGTHFTPPLPAIDQKGKLTGKFLNANIPAGQPGAITAPDAGIVGKGGGPKSGQGWQFVGLFSEHGTLLGWDISALNRSEHEGAERVLKQYETEVLPHRGDKTVSVCTADGGFNSSKIRKRLQELRVAPNIHKASHGELERSKNNVASRDKMRWSFVHPSKRHYKNWGANGHAEISCDCGLGATERVFQIGKSGKLSIATRGDCKNCGAITITSGKWRKTKDYGGGYTLALDGGDDPAVGNSLTFHDPIATEYGKDRFGWNESIHATLMRRFGLLKQSWMRSKTEVETEFAIAASAISLLILERAQRQKLTHFETDADSEQAA